MTNEWRLSFRNGVDSARYCADWRRNGEVVVHLTMYGINIDDVIDEIAGLNRDILIAIGAKKVLSFFYEIADYNVAIGHQLRSEIAALAVFLD